METGFLSDAGSYKGKKKGGGGSSLPRYLVSVFPGEREREMGEGESLLESIVSVKQILQGRVLKQ